MSKAREITGLDCNADALEWAGIVLRVRLEEVLDFRGSALDFTDIEGVHNMRVATRRLRSALRDFAPLLDKKLLKQTRRELKQLADALGGVRDEDVAIDALEKLAASADTPQIKNGIESLINERCTVRGEKQMDLIEALAISHLTGLQENFTLALDEALRGTKAAQEMSFTEAGSEAVSEALQEFVDLGASLYKPFDIEELHDLRIAAKRLRYAIELFTPCWGEVIEPYAEQIGEMQSHLGELHDCDVWIENLGEVLIDKKGNFPNGDERQAAVWLMSEFTKRRTKHYRAALKLWSEWQTSDFITGLQTLIQRPEICEETAELANAQSA